MSGYPEAFKTADERTLPFDMPLPRLLWLENRMHGVTHQQWFNSYLERRSAYFDRCIENETLPTVGEFNRELSDNSPNSYASLGKISAAVNKVIDCNKPKGMRGIEDAPPLSLTRDGAKKVIDQIRGKTKTAGEKAKARRAESIGRFVLDNDLALLDPRTETIIDPKTLKFGDE